jgi:hypothetical protein
MKQVRTGKINRKQRAFRIQRGFPVPKLNASKYRALLLKMKVGDSVVVTHHQLKHLRTTSYDLGFTVSARRLKTGQIRVWLVHRPRRAASDS